jgi:hypothetical protein
VRRITIAVLIGVASGASVNAVSDCSEIHAVSIVQILTLSGLADDVCVQVHGYLLGGDLFLSTDYAKMLDFLSAVKVSDTDNGDLHRYCDDRYVRIVARLGMVDGRPILYDPVHVVGFDGAEANACWTRQ